MRRIVILGLSVLVISLGFACEDPSPTSTPSSLDGVDVFEDGGVPSGDGSALDGGPSTEPPSPLTPPVIDDLLPTRPSCESAHRPVVMVHGMLASGDTWTRHTLRFEANGSCPGHVVALDWNTLGGGDATEGLDALIDALLASTGADQVDLVGHSAGTGVSISYLSDAGRAAKVAHYVHVGAGPPESAPGTEGEVQTLNLWSVGDLVADGADSEPVSNVMLEQEDHYEVATSAASFEAIYTFLNDGVAPVSSDIATAQEDVFEIWGKGLTLGENDPVTGGTVTAWSVDAATGSRQAEVPVAVFTVGAYGWWGPLPVQPGVHYELVLQPSEPDALPVRHYFMPFTRPHDKVVLRALPGPGSMVAILLGAVPFDDASTVQVVAYSAHQAVIHGRDTLTVGDVDLATAALASAASTTIAIFCYDDNGNEVSDGDAIALFSSLPFLQGVDIWIPADPAGTTAVTFNGRTLQVAQRGDGAVIAVLE